MELFLSRIKTSSSGREHSIKESLLAHLSNSVKEIQLEHSDENIDVIGASDSTNTLCTVLESILLHGLRDTFLMKAKNVFSGGMDEPPEPSFWPLILVYSHRQIIDQINCLQQISTDIGRCRAWIRLALNDSLLSSYMDNIRRDNSALSPYYKRTAFIRDLDLLDVAQRYMGGVETCVMFSLPCNSSLLNSWTNQTLLMAGIWSPAMKSCPISSSIDVVSTLGMDVPQRSVSNSHASSFHSDAHYIPSPANSLSHMLAMNEDEALKVILANGAEETFQPKETFAKQTERKIHSIETSTSSKLPKAKLTVQLETVQDNISASGNSLIGKVGWSSSKQICDNPTSSHVSSTKNITIKSPIDVNSYNSLLENYSLSGSYDKTTDLRDTLDKLDSDLCSELQRMDENNIPESLGFEVIAPSPSAIFSLSELQTLVKQLCTLSNEHGLDSQNYTCKGCSDSLGINFSKAQVCAFSGEYFCSECMFPDSFIIPAKVVFNWDFKCYPVSCKSAIFLKDFQHQPLIDFKILNPHVYTVIEEFANLQLLRIQLNFVRAYLFTCREPIIEELQKKVWPREYLYEHVHMYSISDLLQIPGGSLAQQLQRVVNFGIDHVTNCWLCKQKGFICEVCNSPKVLYPFNVISTFRCPDCSAVFHATCVNAVKPCPKCERKKKREDLPLLNAITTS